MIKTLQDIADAVGVSRGAVSQVLNSRPIRISRAKCNMIQELADKHDFRFNLVARSLRSRRTKSIAIIVPDMSTHFYPSLVRAIETALGRTGYRTFVCNTYDDPAQEEEVIEDCLSRLVDGYVVVPVSEGGREGALQGVHAAGKLLVCMDRYVPDAPYNYVVSDNEGGARQGVELLARSGIRQVAYVGSRRRNHALDERQAGARGVAQERGLGFTAYLANDTRKDVATSARGAIKAGTGLFVESNRHLMGVLDGYAAARQRVTDRMPLIGFDAFEPVVRSSADLKALTVLDGPVPYLQQNIDGMGQHVAEFLLAAFEKGTAGECRKKLPVEIVEGGI